MENNEYIYKGTAYVCLSCLNAEPELWKSALVLSNCTVGIVRNKGMLLFNTTLELEFSSWILMTKNIISFSANIHIHRTCSTYSTLLYYKLEVVEQIIKKTINKTEIKLFASVYP